MPMGDKGTQYTGREERQEAPAFLGLGSPVPPQRTSSVLYAADRAPF